MTRRYASLENAGAVGGYNVDSRFQSAMAAAWAGRIDHFCGLLDTEAALATARSSSSHPTLLQFVVLDGGVGKISQPEAFARALIDRGAELEGPLVAAASIGSRPMTDLLLSAGAAVESSAPWTPLEESVYWAHSELSRILREEHEARVPSLRAAAGLGDLSEMTRFFRDGAPAEEAGPVRYPWGTPSNDPQDVLDQALVIAAKNDEGEALELLITSGAQVDALPPGIHEEGGALHLAAMLGRGEVVDLLLSAGADPKKRDSAHQATPSAWAKHGGFSRIAERLSRLEQA
jgi:Ankyrin repeats (3 copies)